MSIEIPRVITALQQQNTAPEVQQYDADPYQPSESDGSTGGGASGRGEITISFVNVFFSRIELNISKNEFK